MRVWSALLALAAAAFAAVGWSANDARSQSQTIADPVGHCQRAGTDDAVREDGPAWLGAAVGVNEPGAASWRCADGQVLACAAYSGGHCLRPDQSRSPNAAMISYCREARDGDIPRAGGGMVYSVHTFRCVRGRPVIVPGGGSTAHLDARGFVRDEWTVVTPPATAAAAAPEIYPTRAEFEETGSRGTWSCSLREGRTGVQWRAQPGGAVVGRVPSHTGLQAVRQGRDGWTWYLLYDSPDGRGWARADLISCEYIHPE